MATKLKPIPFGSKPLVTPTKAIPFGSNPLPQPLTPIINQTGNDVSAHPMNPLTIAANTNSHQGALDFIANGQPTPKIPDPRDQIVQNHQKQSTMSKIGNFVSDAGIGLINNFAMSGAPDINASLDEKNPLKAGADLASGLGKSAFSLATFIPQGIYNQTKDFLKTAVSAKDIFNPNRGDNTPGFIKDGVDPALQAMNNSSSDLERGSHLGEAFLGGLGTAMPEFGAYGAVEGLPNNTNDFKGSSAINEKLQARQEAQKVKANEQVDNLVSQITQGEVSDITKAKAGLSSIDREGIKTYKDLNKAANDKVQVVAQKLDDTLDAKNPNPIPIKQLNMTAKVGDETISHNYVNDALGQLQELYKKVNDPQSLAEVQQLVKKAKTTGLTLKEVNNLARQYGNEFDSKAFSKSGESLTSVNAQALENTRSGIKSTARQIFGDKSFQAADSEITNLIKVRDLSKKMIEKVNDLQQKIQPRGLGEKAGRLVGKILDTAGLGSPKGFMEYFTRRGEGAKVLNALDLQNHLSDNLAKLEKISNAVDGNVPEAKINSMLQGFLDSSVGKALNKEIKLPAGNKEAGFVSNPFSSGPADRAEMDQLNMDNLVKNSKGQSAESIIENAEGWKTAGDKAKFDAAVMHGDKATIQKLIPNVPEEYLTKFSKEIESVIGMPPEKLQGIAKTNPILFKKAQQVGSVDEFIDAMVKYGKTTKENVSTSALTDFYNQVKGEPQTLKGGSGLRPGQAPIGAKESYDLVARERFDIPKLKKISFGGSDRDVYDLGDGNVLKISKSSRGLTQNAYSSDYFAEDAGLIPKTIEVGKNYVVKEKVDSPNVKTKQLVKQLEKLSNQEIIDRSQSYQNIMAEHGLEDMLNYDVLPGDLARIRNWGSKNGEPILVDEGTLNGNLVKNDTVKGKNLSDPEFRQVYDQSRAAKKKFGDLDKKTMYGAGAIPAATALQQLIEDRKKKR